MNKQFYKYQIEEEGFVYSFTGWITFEREVEKGSYDMPSFHEWKHVKTEVEEFVEIGTYDEEYPKPKRVKLSTRKVILDDLAESIIENNDF